MMETFSQVVELMKECVREQISEVAFTSWIAQIEGVKMMEDAAVVYVKTTFQKNVLEKQYMDKIVEGFERVLGFSVRVIIATEEDLETYVDGDFIKSSSMRPRLGDTDFQAGLSAMSVDSKGNGTYEYTFDTFIVGTSNNFAYAASKAVATQQSGSYNPLFIYGASGLGKTHLLMAISNEIRRQHPEKLIVSVSSESFTNELIAAIQSQSIDNFHNKYRKADVLLVDDVQFIAGKERTQEEFFHTFNDLFQFGKQIVLTSDRPPKDIKTLEDRLKSRFEWGLLTDISPPDFETRVAILNRKAALMNINMPGEVSEFIADKLKTNIRQLEGTIKKMQAYSLYANSPLTIALAQTVIKEILSDNQPIPVTVEKIIEEVAKTYSISPEDIRSKKRNAKISAARQVAVYIIREVTQMSMAAIGDEFKRDHSTIVYSINQTRDLLETDSRLKAIIEDIVKNIKNS